MYAVITGATKGIGRATAYALAEEGHHIFFCARTEEDVESLENKMSKKYPDRSIIGKAVDLSDKQTVFQFADTIRDEWPRVDILVNNAGIFKSGAIHKEEVGTLENMIETNVYSAYYLTKGLLPHMLPHKSGHIFNLGSVASIKAHNDGGAYTISKFAMRGFTKALREEMKEYGIRVTSVLPGATWTSTWEGADFPRSRLMQPEDVAIAIKSAVSMDSSAVVEEILIRPQLGDIED